MVLSAPSRSELTRLHDEKYQRGSILIAGVYKNHSVRATAITLWSNAGISNRHKMAISGHRSENSLAHYNTRPSKSKLRTCSEVLSQSLVTSTPGPSLSSVTVRQNNSVVVAPEKAASFPQSVFSNCTFHGCVNIVFKDKNPSSRLSILHNLHIFH